MSLVEAKALAELATFLSEVPWDRDDLVLASRSSPHVNVGRWNREVVEGDLALNQAYWRILALLDPLRLPAGSRDFGSLYQLLKSSLSEQFAIDEVDARKPAKDVARFLSIEVQRLTKNSRRISLSIPLRNELIDSSGQSSRCWYCGHPFLQSQVRDFLQAAPQGPSLRRPRYVDFTAPRGRAVNDLHIEVDHVHPHSKGGDSGLSNLRLACGWCNRHKSALSILFDARSAPEVFVHQQLGSILTPVPFWVVRVLGTQRRCQAQGCVATSESEKLVLASGNEAGALVPGNLVVYCTLHDPMSAQRLVPTKDLK